MVTCLFCGKPIVGDRIQLYTWDAHYLLCQECSIRASQIETKKEKKDEKTD